MALSILARVRGALSLLHGPCVGNVTQPYSGPLSKQTLSPPRRCLGQVSLWSPLTVAPRGGHGIPLSGGTVLSVRSIKVRASLKLLCKGCRFVVRKGRLRVVCTRKPRHKQRQGWWLWTSRLNIIFLHLHQCILCSIYRNLLLCANLLICLLFRSHDYSICVTSTLINKINIDLLY